MLKIDTITLPKEILVEANPALLSQAIHVYQDRLHKKLSKTKTRAEVNRTKKKVYKQKGTGGARHGSRSAPIYVGGGVAHGPLPFKKILNLPKKIKEKALKAALKLKVSEKKLIVISGISTLKKTKDLANFIQKIGFNGSSLLVLAEINRKATKFARNLKNLEISMFKDLNAYRVLLSKTVFFDTDIFESKKKPKSVSKNK